MKNPFRKIPRYFSGRQGKLSRSYTSQKFHTGNKAPHLNRMSRGYYKKSKGQGLVEYLILIALMGVATIGIVRTLNQTVKSRFANAIYALQGRKQKAKTHTLKKEEYQRSDLSNFMTGATSSDKTSRSKRD
ncbi:MAG: hypothetical protein OXB86_00060 [Bdellovibrionales bacterium]|nr:hypothetical protein [Bdellovibrionales bacterium]